MEQLRPVELKLVDELFGMSSGYVLDFNNRTFADFFRREGNGGVTFWRDGNGADGRKRGHLRNGGLTTRNFSENICRHVRMARHYVAGRRHILFSTAAV